MVVVAGAKKKMPSASNETEVVEGENLASGWRFKKEERVGVASAFRVVELESESLFLEPSLERVVSFVQVGIAMCSRPRCSRDGWLVRDRPAERARPCSEWWNGRVRYTYPLGVTVLLQKSPCKLWYC